MVSMLHQPQPVQLQAVILDWAGTTVDYGCFAPTQVFIQLFQKRGVPITIEQARAPMGLGKLDHLRALARMPGVADQWQQIYGQPPGEEDLLALYQEFIPLQLTLLRQHVALIPGTLEAVVEFRRAGLKIGTTTGYSRQMMDALLEQARQLGYEPDACVCPSEVPAGRPYPWMCYLNAIQLQVYPMRAMVKVGDTLPDIQEGLNAGLWTVGLALTGNGLGLSEAELAALPAETRRERLAQVTGEMLQAGAHYVVDGIWEVPSLLEEIQVRLASGEKP